jgi:hypothetical protein
VKESSNKALRTTSPYQKPNFFTVILESGLRMLGP